MADKIAPSAEFLRSLYEAFNRRDLEAVLQKMDAEVDWPNALEGTRIHGPDAVRQYWMRQFESLDPTVDPQDLTAEDDGRVAVKVHQVVHDKAGALVVDQMVEHVYTIRGGRITHMEIRNPKH